MIHHPSCPARSKSGPCNCPASGENAVWYVCVVDEPPLDIRSYSEERAAEAAERLMGIMIFFFAELIP